MKILITGDLHIDAAKIGKINPNTDLDYRTEDFLRAVSYTIDTANKESVDLFILNGDLYKGRTSTHHIETLFAEQLQRLNPSIKRLINLGNHDYTPKQLSYGVNTYSVLMSTNLPDTTFNLDINHFVYPDLDLVIYPYYDLKRVPELETNEKLISWIEDKIGSFKLTKKRKLFVGHGTPAGTIFNEDFYFDLDMISEPVLPLSLFENFDYALFSHIHRAHWIGKKVFHIGSPERVDFGEADDDKGFVIYDTETNKVEWYSTDPRPMKDLKIDLTSLSEFDDPNQILIDAVETIPNLEKTMVKLSVTCNEQVYSIVDHLSLRTSLSKAFYYKTPSFEVNKIQKTKNKEITEQLTITQALAKVVDARSDLSDQDKTILIFKANAIIAQGKDI